MLDLTAIVATHERPESLNRMIDSFKVYYPDMPFVIVDSSKIPTPREDVVYISMPQDSGISAQRNRALEEVKTKYFLLLDDDFVCTEQTNLEVLLQGIQDGIFDIVWGGVNNKGADNYDFHGTYQQEEGTLYHYVGRSYNLNMQHAYYDVIFNFFVADAEKVRQFWWWDRQLRFAKEHDDFFLQAKQHGLRVGYLPEVIVDHVHQSKYHGWPKSRDCVNHFCQKRNIQDKVEIRHIQKSDSEYISYHHCIQIPTQEVIPSQIQQRIESYYGFCPIIIS